jgi:hypothetical protein
MAASYAAIVANASRASRRRVADDSLPVAETSCSTTP